MLDISRLLHNFMGVLGANLVEILFSRYIVVSKAYPQKEEVKCYIPDFCEAVVIWKATIEPSTYVWLTLMKGYNCENCCALKIIEIEISWIFRKIGT